MSIEKQKILIVSKHALYFKTIQTQVWFNDYDIIFFDNLVELEKYLQENNSPRVIFFPHFSEYIPEKIFSKFICIGFHTGDLPRDRGGTPIQNKISRKEYLTRVNAIQITKSMDAGAIYAHKEINLSKGNISQILNKLSNLVTEMIFEILTYDPVPVPQNELESTFFERITSDEFVNFKKLKNNEIYDKIRMVDGLDYPKAKIKIHDKIFELSNATYENDTLEFTCKLIDRSNE
jgi:methionyl-tRNA formyltransferase